MPGCQKHQLFCYLPHQATLNLYLTAESVVASELGSIANKLSGGYNICVLHVGKFFAYSVGFVIHEHIYFVSRRV